jgi:hypothetical protein
MLPSNAGMPQYRTNKHKCQKPDKETIYIEEKTGDEYLTIHGVKLLANRLIEDGSCTDLDLAIAFLNELNSFGKNKTLITLCSMCAGKIGLKKCAACPKNSKIRYCSRECQVSDWPVHKMSCGKKF